MSGGECGKIRVFSLLEKLFNVNVYVGLRTFFLHLHIVSK
jgi:hypothetical protein